MVSSRIRNLGSVLLALLLQAGNLASAAETARGADAFVDTMGINVHSAFGSYPTNWQAAIDAVKDIGFRYVRDLPYNPDRLNQMTAATGVKLDIIAQYGWSGETYNIANFDATWAQIKQVNNIAYIELPNEPQFLPDWASQVRTWTQKLYQTAKADPALAYTPIISTVAFSGELIADLSPYLDYGNIHSYSAGFLPTSLFPENVVHAQAITGNKPIIATEMGYNNGYLNSTNTYAPGVTEAASAKYLPRVFLEFYNAGIVKTLNYELVDQYNDPTFEQQEAHFGLLRADFSYKPAATALKNLISLLKDPGPDFQPSALNYTITGGNAVLHHTLLQKRDGTFWLALWQDVLSYDPATRTDLVIPPLNLTLNTGIPLVKGTSYLPNNSTDALATAAATHSMNLSVDDRVLLVALQLAREGDTNADGHVDDVDLATFFHHYGKAGAWEDGDFNLDGKVNFADFQSLELNYGTDFSSAQLTAMTAAGVPEPSAMGIATAIAFLSCARRRKARITSATLPPAHPQKTNRLNL